MRQNVIVLLALAVAACRNTTRPDHVTGGDLDKILASMPDSAMRQRWRTAASNGQLPPLELIKVPSHPFTTRMKARVDSTPYRDAPPVIAAGAVAEVLLYSPAHLAAYNGAFRVISAVAGKIAGQLTERPEPVQVVFKVPATAQTLPLRDSALNLTLQQDIVDGSFRRTLLLSSAKTGVVLFDLSDGNRRQPYARTFKELPLSIQQGAAGSESPLTVVYAGQRLAMTPGRTERVRDANGEVAIFLLENYTTRTAAIRGSEADAFHVRLLIWRVT